MVCSPHQYTLQKIATPYMPAVTYIELKDYLQKPAYQFRPQQEMYTRKIEPIISEITTYQPQQQYQLQSQHNERQRNTDANIQFIVPLWVATDTDQPNAISEQALPSTWKDYGLPLYSPLGIVTEINKEQPEQKMKRDDLMQRIQQELAAMKQGKKIQEDYLCAA